MGILHQKGTRMRGKQLKTRRRKQGGWNYWMAAHIKKKPLYLVAFVMKRCEFLRSYDIYLKYGKSWIGEVKF